MNPLLIWYLFERDRKFREEDETQMTGDEFKHWCDITTIGMIVCLVCVLVFLISVIVISLS